MRNSKKLIQLQTRTLEGDTYNILVNIDDVAFINVESCELVLDVYQSGCPIVFAPTEESMGKLLDTLDKNKLAFGGVKL